MAGTNDGALHPLHGNQQLASDPGRHVWLSASAGTGKTQVLAARVWRLLLAGTDPGAILCLTFTKAGAAEMAERITGRLARWVRASDDALRTDLVSLGESATPDRLARARTLFAKVLDAPGGGLRIQTIHSFCQSLLSAFPMEAGLVPGFRPLEGREEAVLLRESLAETLVTAEREGRGALVDTIGALSLRLGEGKAEAFLVECARSQAAMESLPAGIQPFLRRKLDLPEGDIAAELERCCGGDAFDCAGLREIAAMNAAWGTATGLKHFEAIKRWLDSDPAGRVVALEEMASVFTKKDGEPRAVPKKVGEASPGYEALAGRFHTRCAELIGMQARADYADLLAAALDAGRDYAATYARAKRRIGAVDFNDLIRRTVALLEQPGMGQWVRYKLDQATEHVLIDEAQDTNWDQWRIVKAVADEFFAGEGARGESLRTLFSVGDYKQAIFGFQGTDPFNFALAHRYFEQLAEGALADPEGRAQPLDTLSLTQSFRSTAPVLEFVDAAIGALPPNAMGEFSTAETHASKVPGPGIVTLLPPVVEGGSDADDEDWIDDAVRQVARDIARQITGWWRAGLMLESKGRPMTPGDVMILVKRRGELASLIVARLYAEGVPVAGVDRLRLNAPLAVRDLLAAIRFVLQPGDDLSLAALLVSPLVGWSQDELMDSAAGRGRVGLWRHLRDTQSADRLAPLYDLLARADLSTPHRFLEHILSGPMQGRRKLLRRLGEEARDPIEELVTAALNFEGLATPSLQRFLDWFDRGDVDIKRDAAQPQDAVRVMTAHGAKGLQAPVVILADATIDPANNRRDLLEWKADDIDRPAFPIFRPRAGERGGPLAALLEASEARDMEEHWRLFYVAATRAEERLVIGGALGVRAQGVPPERSWYAAAARGLDALGVPAGEGAREFRGLIPQPPVATKPQAATATAAPPVVPAWLHVPAPQESRPPRPLAPSSLGDDAVADPPPSPAMRAAAERGRLLHALFQRLPEVASSDRAVAADRWLAGAGGVNDAETRAALVADALAVLNDPRFAQIFTGDSLAEAPIAAIVDGAVVSGTVDRLLVRPDSILVVDFKTGRRAPASIDDVPPYHLRQMSAYAAALAVIFPDRPVSAALLYSAGPVLHALPPALLAAHKPGFAQSEQSLAPPA